MLPKRLWRGVEREPKVPRTIRWIHLQQLVALIVAGVLAAATWHLFGLKISSGETWQEFAVHASINFTRVHLDQFVRHACTAGIIFGAVCIGGMALQRLARQNCARLPSLLLTILLSSFIFVYVPSSALHILSLPCRSFFCVGLFAADI